MPRIRPLVVVLFALALLAPAGPGARDAAAKEPKPKAKKKRPLDRYPPSFRLKVEEAIRDGVARLKSAQDKGGWFGTGQGPQALGRTALPVLALLKAGVPKDDPAIEKAFAHMRKLPLDRTYSVACYLMAIHARYAPKLDTFDTDVGKMRAKRTKPASVLAKLSKIDRKAVEDGLAYLLEAQNARGLWHYTVPEAKTSVADDLSNVQYALLGLRAAADCGVKVPDAAWFDALRGVLKHQDAKGPEETIVSDIVRGKYVIRRKDKVQLRPFRYKDGKKDGPAGEKTVPVQAATGSMTTAGVACVAICREGLWRTRRFRGGDRRDAEHAVRDGIAWLAKHFTVTENPGHPRKAHHLYYLYGLERMGMLTDRRFLGTHDWYKAGADHLLAAQNAFNGGWGNAIETSFAILFLKRATRGPAIQVTGG